MSVSDRWDAYQQRRTWIGFPLAVFYKFFDDQGGYLAALLAYYALLSLFPLLLLMTTLLAFLLAGDVNTQHEVLRSTLEQFPVIGNDLRTNVHSLRGSAAALVVGVLGSVYGGIGVAQAAQNAMNDSWGVPRNRRPNPLKARLRSAAVVGALGLGVVATTVLSGLFASSGALGHHLGPVGRALTLVVSMLGNIALFGSGFHLLTASPVPRRQLLPGAVAAALSWQVLQFVGGYYMAHTLKGATHTYGFFGTVLGLVAFLHLAAVLTVLSAEVNVVRARRLWPRALLTPFTDDVDLTAADERSYESLARTQQTKGFERIDVSFDGDTHSADS